MKAGSIGLRAMGAGIVMNALQGGHGLVLHDINAQPGLTSRPAPCRRTAPAPSPSGPRSSSLRCPHDLIT